MGDGKIIKDNLRRFVRGTSAKGIPRIVKSDEWFSKLLWLFASLTCLALASYNTIISDYLQYPTVTTVRESKKVSPDPFLLTAIVCNNQPIININSGTSPITLSQYYAKARKLLQKCQSSCAIETKQNLNAIETELMTLIGYQQYLSQNQNKEEKTSLTSSMDLVQSCRYIYQQGFFLRKIECDQTNMNIFKTDVPGFFNCILLESILAQTDINIIGIELVLFFDAPPQTSLTSQELDNTKMMPDQFSKVGASVLLLPQGTAQVRI